MRHSRGVAALATLIVVLGCAGCGRDASGNEGEAASSSSRRGGGFGPGARGPRPQGPAPVDVAVVGRSSIARSVTVSGVVEPIRVVAVNSQLSGQLLRVAAEEGDVVRDGDVLARVDDRELQAQVAAAEASFDVAAAQYERSEQLRDRQVITLVEYEQDRTEYAAAKAQLEQLRTRLSFTTIQAPVAGVVTEKRVEAGDAVGTQTHLFTVADVSTLVVRVGVSELDVVELSVGDQANVRLDAFPGRTFPARVRRIFPTADPSTRLVPVEVALVGTDASVARPGFLARVTFPLQARENALLVPASALVGGAGSEAVFVVAGESVARRNVSTGLTSEGRVEIVEGLTEGDRVVVAGNNLLRDGMAVRVVGTDSSAWAERNGGTQ